MGKDGSRLSSEFQQPRVYTVSDLTREIQSLIEGRFDFVWVEGEISNFSTPASGHYYMVLKDAGSRIRAVMFRLQGRYLKFLPENGMKVVARGRIGVYAPRGEYQLILDYLEPMGVGALAVAFEQVKRKLAALGVFDQEVKRPLPYLPRRVAVITSPTGAAVQDFLKVIRRRFTNIEIVVVPVRVQGDDACEDMVNALELVNRSLDVDVIVLTRGGGSLEDLWAFNREELALAIRRSRIPVVSAVGHEIDTTISDLAADFRAPTPSAAAELLVVEKEALVTRLEDIITRLLSGVRRSLRDASHGLDMMTRALADPRKRLSAHWMRLDELHGRMIRHTRGSLHAAGTRLAAEGRALLAHSPSVTVGTLRKEIRYHRLALAGAVGRYLHDTRTTLTLLSNRAEDLNPRSVLKRGYSITMTVPHGRIVKDASTVGTGDRVRVLLASGSILCDVEEVERTQPREARDG